MPDEHTEQRSGNKGCFLPQLGTFEALALKGTKLNDDNLTLDDDFHLATMMGVWLVTMMGVWLVVYGCLVSALAMMGVWLVSMMGVWLVGVWLVGGD